MKRIFLIENEDSITDFYLDFLRLKGYEMAVSGDVNDFSNRIGVFNPDLVIFDTDMPRSESNKFTILMVTNSELISKPTLLLTGFVNEEKIKGFEELYNYKFLNKSSTNSRILQMIESLLHHPHPESNGFHHMRKLEEVPGLNN